MGACLIYTDLFKGGGDQANFRFRVFWLLKLCHTTILHQISPISLKMTLRVFSSKIIFQILTPIFQFRGIPWTPKNFFSKNFSRKLLLLLHFSIFFSKFQNHVLKNLFGQIIWEADFWFFAVLYFLSVKKFNRAARLNFLTPKI